MKGACAALAVVLVVLAPGAARGDTPIPPDETTGPAAQPSPPAETTPAPAGTPAAPPEAVSPLAPTPEVGGPTLTPDPAAVPPPSLEMPAAPPPPPRKPFYRRDWFWGAVGVVVLTAGIVLFATSGSDAAAPRTTLGNMRAF